MKKTIVTFGVLALTLISLTACQDTKKAAATLTNKTTSSTKAAEKTATFIITQASNDSKSKEVTIKADQTVMDVLKENFAVEEKDGFITSIEGLAQDPAKNLYWMYEVNGTQAAKGAADTPIKAGDKVEFNYEAYN